MTAFYTILLLSRLRAVEQSCPSRTMFPTKYSCCEGDSNVIYRRGMSTRVRKMQVRVLKNHKVFDPLTFIGNMLLQATEKRLNALADESVIQQESHPGTEKYGSLYGVDRRQMPGLRLSTDGSLKYQGKTALIIGAGPGGIMSAVYLAREGFTVQVTILFMPRFCRTEMDDRCLRNETTQEKILIHSRVPIS